MANSTEILTRIDEKAPLKMDLEASIRDYCILALQFLKGQASFSQYFASELKEPGAAIDAEVALLKHARERYCVQLYTPASDPLLADAERLTLSQPSGPQADDRERAMVYIVAVYTLFALTLHGRSDFARLFLEAWDNFNSLASARVIRKQYDKSWHSRYDSLYFPLG